MTCSLYCHYCQWPLSLLSSVHYSLYTVTIVICILSLLSSVHCPLCYHYCQLSIVPYIVTNFICPLSLILSPLSTVHCPLHCHYCHLSIVPYIVTIVICPLSLILSLLSAIHCSSVHCHRCHTHYMVTISSCNVKRHILNTSLE